MFVGALKAAGKEANGVCHEPDAVAALYDQSAETVEPALVRQARKEDMEYFRVMGVYAKSRRE